MKRVADWWRGRAANAQRCVRRLEKTAGCKPPSLASEVREIVRSVAPCASTAPVASSPAPSVARQQHRQWPARILLSEIDRLMEENTTPALRE
jgi:hypothetical protein